MLEELDLDKVFKFKIGEMVYPKIALQLYEKLPAAFGIKSPFQIVERILQECPGGVQKSYKTRGYSFNKGLGLGESNYYMFIEIELEREEKV